MTALVTPRLRSRRLAFVAAAIVVGLAACGSDDSVGDSAPTRPPSVAPSTAVPDGAPPVIRVAAGAATASSASASDAALVEGESAPSNKMMAAHMEFVFEGTAEDLTSPAPAWYFAPGELPAADVVTKLGAQFGVEGAVEQLAPDAGGGLIIGPDDYSAPSVTVGTDPMQSWWYSPGDRSASQPVCEPVAPADGSESEVFECEPLPPPTNVLTEEQAEAKTTTLLDQLGYDPASFVFDSYADEWGSSVSAFLLLDGVRTNVSMYFSYGEAGAVTGAGGFLATAQRGADYPRVGVAAAVERLNSPNWMGGFADARWTAIEEDAIVEDAAADSSPAGAGSSGGSTGDPTVTVEPLPADDRVMTDPAVCDPAADCVPADQEPIVVHLTNPRPSLEQVWAQDDVVWLLPGYAFDSADGGLYTVLAVDDQYLEVAQPDTAPPATDVSAPDAPTPPDVPVTDVPAPDAATLPDVPATDVPAPDAPTPPDVPATDVAPPTTLELPNPQELVGLSPEEAAAVVRERGWVLRVVREDGADLVVTEDFRENRLNVAVVDGLVTDLVNVG